MGKQFPVPERDRPSQSDPVLDCNQSAAAKIPNPADHFPRRDFPLGDFPRGGGRRGRPDDGRGGWSGRAGRRIVADSFGRSAASP